MVTGKEISWGLRKRGGGTSLVAQRLRLGAFNAGGLSSVPGQSKDPRVQSLVREGGSHVLLSGAKKKGK